MHPARWRRPAEPRARVARLVVLYQGRARLAELSPFDCCVYILKTRPSEVQRINHGLSNDDVLTADVTRQVSGEPLDGQAHERQYNTAKVWVRTHVASVNGC